MTAQVESKIESPFLYRVLKIDGTFAAISGVVTILGATFLAELIELENPNGLIVVGVLVLVYGIGLHVFAKRGSNNRKLAIEAIILNLAWVVISTLGLLLGWFDVNTVGKWAIALVAEAVFVFGALEFIGLRRQR